MNKTEIEKIKSFIKDVNDLPDVLLTTEEVEAFISNNKIEQKLTYQKQELLFKKVQDIKIRLTAYFRAAIAEDSSYLKSLVDITFKPKLFEFNTIHFESNKAWLDDKCNLLNLLKTVEIEFEEKDDCYKRHRRIP